MRPRWKIPYTPGVMWTTSAMNAPKPKRKERTMSDDERDRKRKEFQDDEPDVEAHGYVPEDSSELDPERKRKRKVNDEADVDELGKKRK